MLQLQGSSVFILLWQQQRDKKSKRRSIMH